jgi:hypothetical protein
MNKKYFYFLIVSYATALFFEFIANTYADGRLFQLPLWPIGFLVWYGLIYSITFIICRKRPLWVPVLIWAILGPLAEILVFHRFNIIVDPIIYGVMFFVPFWVHHTFIAKEH